VFVVPNSLLGSLYTMTSRLFRDMPSNVSMVINDQDKLSRTTNNSDVKVVGNEDADSLDRPLDVGDHYVVRRPDGSWRESFL
jgi:hypothetical protein